MQTMTAMGHMPRHTNRSHNPIAWLIRAFATHRQRLHLEDLDDHMLEDIGIDAATAHREARRQFWDMPH